MYRLLNDNSYIILNYWSFTDHTFLKQIEMLYFCRFYSKLANSMFKISCQCLQNVSGHSPPHLWRFETVHWIAFKDFMTFASAMSSMLCCVCGDTATSYCHYGARVCHSCRTFFRWLFMLMESLVLTVVSFRRTSLMLMRGAMKRTFFCCLRGGNCTVDVTTRKKCNYCRFDKLSMYFNLG